MRRLVLRAEALLLVQLLTMTWVVIVGPLCWILRDGLGPESSDSTGLFAVYRLLGTCWWGPVLGVLIALWVALSVERTEPRT
ncbi:MAG: hypothetical protein U0746_15115 [Gemmataceae bacterium]